MKKKLGDLTVRDIIQTCRENPTANGYCNCPLNVKPAVSSEDHYVLCTVGQELLGQLDGKDLDIEIEV